MIDQAYFAKLDAQFAHTEEELARLSQAGHSRELQKVVAEHARLREILRIAERYRRLEKEKADCESMLASDDGDEELREMAQADLDQINADLPGAEKKLLVSLLPPDPNLNRNVIMEIRAGTGGDEAGLFAADLYRMYTRFAERKGWKTQAIDASPSTIGGYKEIVFSVDGPGAFKALQYESGGHRVQRIPATEASGRIHTSAATVAVLPEAEEVDEIELKTEDLRIDVYRASGAGGQHVNTTDSAVRITHIPSGIVTQSQDERSQHRNKDKAMRVLKARLLDHIRQTEEAKAASARKSQIGSGDRSERIRTYNFPQNRLTDHRINLTLYSLDRAVEGELDDLFQALLEHDSEQRLAEQMKA